MNATLSLTLDVALIALALAAAMSFVRVAIGPTLADRAVALDLVSITAVGFLVVYALRYGIAAYLDVALLLALIAFVGTVAFAHYITRRIHS